VPSATTRPRAQCPDCGAAYTVIADSCGARFNTLLSLDHARREPWGSRHGQAFAAFALQHPGEFSTSLDRAWVALYQIYVAGDQPAWVFERLMSDPRSFPAEWQIPPRSQRPVATPSMTIADLGDFEATTYPSRLDQWCRAALVMWGLSDDASE
jgi:Family of unknown function (DUF5946)